MNDEPTLAADLAEAETQSVYAWAQDDDADTEVVVRRSWKLPVMLTVLTAAAVAGGVIYALPHGKPQPAPTPTTTRAAVPPAPTTTRPPSPDEQFVSLFRSRGGLVEPGREQMVIDEARGVCARLDQGEAEEQLIRDMLAGTPGMTRYTAELFTDSSIDVYCPQYGPH